MKKTIFLLAFSVLGIAAFAAKQKNVPGDVLWFVEKGFPDRMIVELDDSDIKLDDGTEIDFDEGVWTDVNSENSKYGVPYTALPNEATRLILTRFKGVKIVKLERTRGSKFEVHLENGAEIKFDESWRFEGIDQ